MSSTFHEKSALALEGHVMLAAWNLDMLARLSILEGAAARPPGSWLRHKERGFAEALEFFGPTLNALWTTTRDTGVYGVALQSAGKVLRGVSGHSADDLVQELTVGSSSAGGPRRQRLFYAVGSALRKDLARLQGGSVSPNSPEVRGTIHNWVGRAARDIVQSWRERHISPSGHREPAHGVLNEDQRSKLFMLAFQSTGQVGRKIRAVIDHEIDHTFGKKSGPLVRLFLEKISHPQYRSVQEMKRLMGKRWDVNQWFTQAYNKVRKEIMAETGNSPATLTNVLGSKATNVFRFMRERVGRNPEILKIIEQLADQIELLEPGQVRMGANDKTSDAKEEALTERQTPHQSWAAMRDWLSTLMTPPKPKPKPTSMAVPMDVETGEIPAEEGMLPEDTHADEKESAELLPEQTPKQPWHSVQDWFEKDEHAEWGTQAYPKTEPGRGAVPLRVASGWMHKLADEQWKKLKEETDFHQWVQGRKFRHQETGNMDAFVSLPGGQQTQLRDWWKANKCTPCAGKGKQQGFTSETSCPSCGGSGVGAGTSAGHKTTQMMDTLKDLMGDPDAGKGLPGQGSDLWNEIVQKQKSGNPLHVMRSVRKFMYELPHEQKHGGSGRYTKLYKAMKEAFSEYQDNLSKTKGDEVDIGKLKKGERLIMSDPRSGSSTSKYRDITISEVEDLGGPERIYHYDDATGISDGISARDAKGKVKFYRPKTPKQAAVARLSERWRFEGVR